MKTKLLNFLFISTLVTFYSCTMDTKVELCEGSHEARKMVDVMDELVELLIEQHEQNGDLSQSYIKDALASSNKILNSKINNNVKYDILNGYSKNDISLYQAFDWIANQATILRDENLTSSEKQCVPGTIEKDGKLVHVDCKEKVDTAVKLTGWEEADEIKNLATKIIDQLYDYVEYRSLRNLDTLKSIKKNLDKITRLGTVAYLAAACPAVEAFATLNQLGKAGQPAYADLNNSSNQNNSNEIEKEDLLPESETNISNQSQVRAVNI